MIREICQYIETNVAGLELASNLFCAHAPEGSGESRGDEPWSTVLESGGLASFYLTDKKEWRFQILTRGNDYHTARAQAHQIHDFLNGKTQVAMPVVDGGPEYLVQVIESVQMPQYLGVDEKGLHMISTNYVVKTQDL